ncbi:MAG: efflux RND transporter permease subunit, partial [Chitinispirillia bacterium]
MKNLFEFMVENHVSANLVMILIIIVGLISVFSLKQEIFPDTPLDTISIEIVYRGASPGEIERTIVRKTEDAIVGINGIEQVRSTAAEGVGIVTAEIGSDQDLTNIKEKITNAVERLTDLPKNSDKPIIKENIKDLPVIEIGIFGSVDEITLKNASKRVEQDLLQFPQISHIDVSGVREFEIAIEVSEQSLQECNLTFDHITEAVRKGSINLPGGKIKNEHGEILIRTDGLGMTKEHYENIVVKTDAAGKIIRIGDIAEVIEGFEDTNIFTSFDGKPAALITVYRTGNYGALEVAEVVKKYVEELETATPPTLSHVVWQDRSLLLQQRLRLLLKNASIGFGLVLIALTLFLEIRLAFWVALGIVLSFLGGFIVMALSDVTINMISLFAFIIVLGIVVDDAIVIGESIYSKRGEGLLPIDASKQGASQIMLPVIFAVLTTVAAFIPLFFIDGIIGKIAEVVAIVVISVLIISLFEALFILPAHIASVKKNPDNILIKLCNKISYGVNTLLQLFIEKVFNPILKICLVNRFTVCALCIAALLLCFGLIYSGIIKFTFLPVVEGDTVCAQLTMSSGSSFEETKRVVEKIENAAALVQDEFKDRYPHLRDSLFKHNFAIIGEHPSNKIGIGDEIQIKDPSLAEITMELLSSQARPFSTNEIIASWQKYCIDLPGVKSLVFKNSIFSTGHDIDIQLSAPDFKILPDIVNDVKKQLLKYQGVHDVRDSYEKGKDEVKLHLKPDA